MKGEKVDFMLIQNGDQLQYIPVMSKIKLNKKRLAQMDAVDSEGEPINKAIRQANQIYAAPRGMTADDSNQVANSLLDLQIKSLVPSSHVVFRDKSELAAASKVFEKEAKELFKVAEPSKDADDDQMADSIFEASEEPAVQEK